MFPLTLFYNTMVPTYLSGVIGFAFCSLGPDPLNGPDPERLAALGPMDYYSAQIHQASFVLPPRCLDLLPTEVADRQS
jgi:spermidine synthase